MHVPVVRITPIAIGARAGTWIEASIERADEAAHDALFDETERALAGVGLSLADAVRSRLTTATRVGRATGSLVRLRRLAIPYPVATSSYIDPDRFDGADGAVLETLAVEDARLGKRAVEHRPSPPPWKVIVTGDLAFVTGASSSASGLDAQLDDIRARLAERLGLGAELIGAPLRVTCGTAYLARDIGVADLGDLAVRVGLPGLTLTIARCDGFASPDSRIEVEADAVAAPDLGAR